jgi:putative nucleotidyltransferase with HDIG domain
MAIDIHSPDPEFPNIVFVHSDKKPSGEVLNIIRNRFVIRALQLSQFLGDIEAAQGIFIFDTEGMSEKDLISVAAWRQSPSGATRSIIFITDVETRSKVFELGLNREANLVTRPLVEHKFFDLVRQLCLRRIEPRKANAAELREKHYAAFPAHAEALRSCDQILDEIFGAFATSERLDAEDISSRSRMMINSLGERGLTDWVDAVRAHHDRTYQHCLLVTGTLLAFGHHLKMNRADLERLAVGGLLHDIGKADIPLTILDKPGALTPDEQVVMRSHATTGVTRLKHVKGVTPQLVAFVGNHHEYLDGSGYPNGLAAKDISDPVRLLTIADIFAALIERRSYKPEMPTEEALAVLESMTMQLDQAILATVKPVLSKVRP